VASKLHARSGRGEKRRVRDNTTTRVFFLSFVPMPQTRYTACRLDISRNAVTVVDGTTHTTWHSATVACESGMKREYGQTSGENMYVVPTASECKTPFQHYAVWGEGRDVIKVYKATPVKEKDGWFAAGGVDLESAYVAKYFVLRVVWADDDDEVVVYEAPRAAVVTATSKSSNNNNNNKAPLALWGSVVDELKRTIAEKKKSKEE
jgi:hypothetical protein